MIPVVILPIISRFDLADRMFRSFDIQAERLVIVDNSLSGWTWEPDPPLAVGEARPGVLLPTFGRVQYIRPILGLGNHGGINAGISQTPEAPWWLFVSNDLIFAPGDLAEIVRLIEESDEPCVVTGDRSDSRYLSFSYGAINRSAVEKVGLVDEWTFYPIFYGDNDYYYRCKLAGVEWVEYNGQIRHGDRDGMTASTTIRSSAAHSLANQRTAPENRRRYIEKWGGPPDHEVYRTPWDLPVPLDWTRIDIAGRAARKW